MSYSGAVTVKSAREQLGQALAAVQELPDLPEDAVSVMNNLAQAVGALFEAERASSEQDGKACVKNALSVIGQTLALMQDLASQDKLEVATKAIASAMSTLYPLTQVPTRFPQPVPEPVADTSEPARPKPPRRVTGEVPAVAPAAAAQAAPAPAKAHSEPPKASLEVNIGATTESNFFVGFSGEISEGGVFAATYNIMPKATKVEVLVTLPGGFEKTLRGRVRFVRDPMDMNADSEPGIGIQFDALDPEARELILRFIRKRPPMFYDD